VDTFQTINGKMSYFANGERHEQQDMAIEFNPENTKRINRQRAAPIRVVIANPPYNAGQVNENDNNKNRKYPELDRRVSATYGDASDATLLRKLSDPYVKALRFATDRIGDSGIVCFVNNNSFVAEKTFDGMRKELRKDFDEIYVLDLGGNVRKNPKLSGTTHNVFGIQVGVSINLFIRHPKGRDPQRRAKIHYYAVARDWRKERKYQFLGEKADIHGVKWAKLDPDDKGNWITNDTDREFAAFLPIGSKEAKAGTSVPTIFRTYSLGVSTNRDAVVYDFSAKRLVKRVEQFAEDYNAEIHRWKKKGKPSDIDSFVNYEKVKWSETLKRHFTDEHEALYSEVKICKSLYRPFTEMQLYYDPMFVDRPGKFDEFLPNRKATKENKLICVSMTVERPFAALLTNAAPNLVAAGGFGCATFALPLFSYSEDGKHRQDNVTSKARTLFQIFYDDDGLTREDIFHYVYALLHHPAYRARYAENLKRELPRIPFVGTAAGEKSASFFPLAAVETMQGNAKPDHNPKASAKLFHAFADAGKKLADLHVNYESAKEFPLQRQENKEVKLDWRVEAMKLSKDKASLFYNDFLTLSGIPGEAYDYRLGNRSALEWVIDQYRVTRDEKGNIASDPNRMDDEQYIVRLIGRVITVSLETQKVIGTLPEVKAA
jgi:predicted helicase